MLDTQSESQIWYIKNKSSKQLPWYLLKDKACSQESNSIVVECSAVIVIKKLCVWVRIGVEKIQTNNGDDLCKSFL